MEGLPHEKGFWRGWKGFRSYYEQYDFIINRKAHRFSEGLHEGLHEGLPSSNFGATFLHRFCTPFLGHPRSHLKGAKGCVSHDFDMRK